MVKIDALNVPEYIHDILVNAKEVIFPASRDEMLSLAMGGEAERFEVGYDVPGKGSIKEANVVKCKNGLAVNYYEDYMRRRDPDSLIIGDDAPTQKPTYKKTFGGKFEDLRLATFAWLKNQSLIVIPFMSGDAKTGYPSLLIAPKNAGFFAAGLADLQGYIPSGDLSDDFTPQAVIYLAPPFRHTHFDGKQIVVHNRRSEMHELFSYNLYPGPSAKKGVYGFLLNIGEKEGWVTAHASAVQVVTPYDNVITIMHEGASGGGKSEMIEPIHREENGQVLVGVNMKTKFKHFIIMRETCTLRPVVDDMALCHPSIQTDSGLLSVEDAENGWFLRINHIDEYGTSPLHEKLATHPKEPLIFLNIEGVPNATCLIWEHTMDSNGKPCPNPRVIMPRNFVPDVVQGPVEVDVRSFGVRTPPCTKEAPSYGILGLFHILPPGLAWLWRLVAPRGFDNPSIISDGSMTSEGIGSYWPFATGDMTTQANLLLEQFVNAHRTRHILIPNQHIGVFKMGFMPQWITREYLARRGSAKFPADQLVESRSHLLGYALESVKVDGTYLPKGMLQTNLQYEVGDAGFDAGNKMLFQFFKQELKKFNNSKLNPLGKQLIEVCLDKGSAADYEAILPIRL